MTDAPSYIELARRSLKLTQLELSRLTGIRNTKICLIERGYLRPSKPEIRKLQKVLKIKIQG